MLPMENFIMSESKCCSSYGPSLISLNEIALPERLSFGISDYFKVIYSWIFAFRRTFIIKPGLYFTGDKYDINTPLLVTCNYHMTVFVLWRILKSRNVRILVIDTEGINVWCSSGKGKFSADEIIKQIKRYNKRMFTESDTIDLILPKLSLSGVSIAELRKNYIYPKIGPVYARDLPQYLDDKPLKNCNDHKFMFSLKDRIFTLIPSLFQMIKYSVYITAVLFIWNYFFSTGLYWQIIPMAILIVVLYVILFPVLPSKRFSVKGLFLYSILAAMFSVYYFIFNNKLDILSYLFFLFFLGGGILFFSLSYTGNSGVSNYSLVKKEIIRYLPVTVVFFLASMVTLIIKGVNK